MRLCNCDGPHNGFCDKPVAPGLRFCEEHEKEFPIKIVTPESQIIVPSEFERDDIEATEEDMMRVAGIEKRGYF